jgi:nucleoid-associated protein YgaU
VGIFQFIREAGEKLFGRGQAQAADASATTDPAQGVRAYIDSLNLASPNLDVGFDPATATVTLTGNVDDQATRERLILAAGNVEGVAQVDDQLQVAHPQPAARFHTVTKGDTLSAIAKTYYGNAGQYPKIFEANKPMLSHPDKIYPGQVLRIPE